MEDNKIKITSHSLKVHARFMYLSRAEKNLKSKVELPPAHFVKDEMQNRRLIVDGLTMEASRDICTTQTVELL